MRKMMLWMLMLAMMLVLIGCQNNIDPEIMALQSQYDDYRTNGFGEFDQYVQYVNDFSLITMHAGVYINVESRTAGTATLHTRAYGIIIDQDDDYYYAVTDKRIVEVSAFRRNIIVENVFDVLNVGEVAATNEEARIILIRFQKTADALQVAVEASAMPLPNEPVILLSRLHDIRSQMTFGVLTYTETSFSFTTNVTLDEGIIGGGLFDVNHRLIGLVLSDDGTTIVTHDVLYDLLQDIL